MGCEGGYNENYKQHGMINWILIMSSLHKWSRMCGLRVRVE